MFPLSKFAYVREETAMNFFMYFFRGYFYGRNREFYLNSIIKT